MDQISIGTSYHTTLEAVYITFIDSSWLDGKLVILARILDRTASKPNLQISYKIW